MPTDIGYEFYTMMIADKHSPIALLLQSREISNMRNRPHMSNVSWSTTKKKLQFFLEYIRIEVDVGRKHTLWIMN